MNVERPTGSGDDAVEALSAVIAGGETTALGRWLDRALDPEGVPKHLPVAVWPTVLIRLAAARRGAGADWPELLDARMEGFFRSVLRFARPDGSTVFSAEAPAPATRPTFRAWAGWLADPGLERVVDWWFPARSGPGSQSPPPLPAWSRPDRPLAILRANWSVRGDFLAVDHRVRGPSTAFELFGKGQSWIGPTWTADGLADAPGSAARPTVWLSNSSADLMEWTFRLGPARITRTALLLRGRALALLAEQVAGPGPTAGFRLALPAGIEAGPIADSRALALTTGRGRSSARVIPLGLSDSTDPGSIRVVDRTLRLEQSSAGRRRWLPLLVSWEPARHRRPLHWRTVTVSEKSQICPPETAFAARLTWGRDDTLVVYRSLGRPALRAFLGHQTRARFLVGLFTAEGTVTPLVTLED